MSKEAVGAYLRTLRESLKLTQVALAEDVETNESQIIRLEQGRVDTRGSLLMAVTQVLGGRPDDIQRLILNPQATARDGIALANMRLWQTEEPMSGVADTDVTDIYQALRSDARRLGLWIGYGRSLVDTTAKARPQNKRRYRRKGRM